MHAFLLTRQWRDTPHGISLDLWLAGEEGPVFVEITGQEAVFFVLEDDVPALTNLIAVSRTGEAKLRNVSNRAVVPVYFSSQRQLREAASQLQSMGISHWEADIRPPERFLMERFITGGVDIEGESQTRGKTSRFRDPKLAASDYRPRLKIISLDIETSMDAGQLYSIAVFGEGVRRVFMVGGETEDGAELSIVGCGDEQTCLRLFLRWLGGYDPDVLIGWNLVQFDLWVLESLCRKQDVRFAPGRDSQVAHWREDEDSNRRYVQIPGRVALDGIELMKAANYNFPSFALETVAQHILGAGKLLHSADRGREISELFADDKPQLAAYNLKDCELVWDIANRTSLVEFAIERSQLTGLALDRSGGSVAAFEY
ncbi:MAG: 3'-5' exonuclease, partial [Cellvibrionaceae bacterium]